MTSTTESHSRYHHLEKMEVHDLLVGMNKEDHTVPERIAEIIPKITPLIDTIVSKMEKDGRLFYIGAGTSGRLGILDASEIPPTYGMPYGKVIGLIAGGDTAIRKAVEHAEDDHQQAWKDLCSLAINKNDVLIGISASGTTPYVVGGLGDAQKNGVITGGITCNMDSPLAQHADFPIEIIVGPELVTGSTRLKAGTAQKLVLNMISTCTMIRLGRVKDNKMVDMRLSNNKLVNRGINMLVDELGISWEEAKKRLEEHGSVRKAMDSFS